MMDSLEVRLARAEGRKLEAEIWNENLRSGAAWRKYRLDNLTKMERELLKEALTKVVSK